jgi:hypothetical protein
MNKYRYIIAFISILTTTVLILISFGQPLIAASGKVYFWSFAIGGPDTSQHISDWYSFSHFIHGILFFIAISYLFKKMPVGQKFLIATIIESAWEILENTPMIIDRYRQGALAAGYFGDSVLNSFCDILFMCLGFIFIQKFGWKVSLVVLIFFELLVLYFIRDNLTLNIIMLLYPFEGISAWQTAV